MFLKFHIELHGYLGLGKTGLSKIKSKGLKKQQHKTTGLFGTITMTIGVVYL